MWLQRERIFSRWKERFFNLTQDYLQCFKRGSTPNTEMGPFLFQVRLSEIQSLAMVDRKGYLTVLVEREGEDNMLVRRSENLREWFNLLQKLVRESKTRIMKTTEQFWAKKPVLDSEKMEEWLAARSRIGARYQYVQERQRSTLSMDRKDKKKHKLPRSESESLFLTFQCTLIVI